MVAEADKRGIGDASQKAAVGRCFGGLNVLPAKRGDIKAAVFVLHGSKDPVSPKADRDALEAEMDGAVANWQLMDFGGHLHSFAEEEAMMKGMAEYNAAAAHQTYRILDDFIQDVFNKKL